MTSTLLDLAGDASYGTKPRAWDPRMDEFAGEFCRLCSSPRCLPSGDMTSQKIEAQIPVGPYGVEQWSIHFEVLQGLTWVLLDSKVTSRGSRCKITWHFGALSVDASGSPGSRIVLFRVLHLIPKLYKELRQYHYWISVSVYKSNESTLITEKLYNKHGSSTVEYWVDLGTIQNFSKTSTVRVAGTTARLVSKATAQ